MHNNQFENIGFWGRGADEFTKRRELQRALESVDSRMAKLDEEREQILGELRELDANPLASGNIFENGEN